MMKKSTILSLATAAAVVATSVGTFAAYDTVEAKATASNVSFRAPVTIEAAAFTMSEGENSLNTLPSASGDVTFNVENEDTLAKNLKLVISVTDSSTGQKLDTNDFTFDIQDKSVDSNSGCSGSDTTWNDTDLTDANVYTVTATLKESAASKLSDSQHDGQISIEVTGTLS